MEHTVRNVQPENEEKKKQPTLTFSTLLNTCCVEFKHIYHISVWTVGIFL